MIFPMLSRSRPAASSFETKDALVALPFVGSAIAMSWEVGSFIPISGIGGGTFGLFSLSEHLSFAIEALPIGLVCAAMLPIIFSGASRPPRSHPRRPSRADGRSIRIGIRIGVTILALVGAGIAALRIYGRSSPMLVLSFAVFALTATFALYPPAMLLWPKQLFVAAAAFAMAMAMALGLDYTREILNVPGRHTVHAVINDANKEIVVLRTGERGLLIYEPDSRRFAFAKWDTVKGFDWPRQPILNVK
jgi:hypothetical protein